MRDGTLQRAGVGPGAVRIRGARPGDVPLLRAMFVRTMPRVFEAIVSRRAAREMAEAAGAALDGAWPLAAVADVSGRAVGLALVRGGRLSMLWLDEPYRGRGLGSLLLARVEAAVVRAGVAALRLETYAANLAAVRFYRARGWRVLREYAGRHGALLVEMEKTLGLARGRARAH